MVALLFDMVYRGLGKVVDKAGDQQDFEVVEFKQATSKASKKYPVKLGTWWEGGWQFSFVSQP
jgi:hypothetical protein